MEKNDTPPADDLLTAQEAAKLLGVTEMAVRKARQAGRLATVHIHGRKLVRRSDVLAYKARTQPDGVPLGHRPPEKAR